MASTTNVTSDRKPASTRRSHNGSRRSASAQLAAQVRSSREDELSDQIHQLQADLKAIAATLSDLAGDKVTEAQSMAKREARHLVRSGQHAVEDVQDEFGQLEKQIKDTIREKPLTAVAGAIALGFVLAVVSR